MAGLNRVQIIGYLGADPEVRYTQSGQPVASLRVAATEKWKDKDGKPQERTEWFSVTAWGALGENCGRYLTKGRMVFVEGRVQSSEYTDKAGIERRKWEIVASSVQFFGGGDGGEKPAPSSGGGPPARRPGSGWDDKPPADDGTDDPIPF